MKITLDSFAADKAAGMAWLTENGLEDADIVEIDLDAEGTAVIYRLSRTRFLINLDDCGCAGFDGCGCEGYDVLHVRQRVPLQTPPPPQIVADWPSP